jgi:trk system potassium uptake protein TrkH
MLFLCSFATSAGSTGGGIKMIRAIILYKQVYRELMRAMHPAVVRPVRLGGEAVPQNILFAVLAFGFMYMVSLVSMTLLLSFSGLEIVTAFSAVVASMTNTGPGLNQVGPATTYEVLTDFQTWVCTFAMLLGRPRDLHAAGGVLAGLLAQVGAGFQTWPAAPAAALILSAR